MSSTAFACFDCRISMKRDRDVPTIVCPTCKGIMYSILFAEGFRFFGSDWGKGIPLPDKYRDVKRFIEENPTHGLRTKNRSPELIPK